MKYIEIVSDPERDVCEKGDLGEIVREGKVLVPRQFGDYCNKEGLRTPEQVVNYFWGDPGELVDLLPAWSPVQVENGFEKFVQNLRPYLPKEVNPTLDMPRTDY